jgi:hypothetical protein
VNALQVCLYPEGRILQKHLIESRCISLLSAGYSGKQFRLTFGGQIQHHHTKPTTDADTRRRKPSTV